MIEIEFEYAESLKNDFEVKGEFYRLDRGEKEALVCRRRVEICLKNSAGKSTQPDAVAVLMNPGSIRFAAPTEEVSLPQITNAARLPMRDTHLKSLKPDNTQYQLMRLMRQMGWERLRLINLSDLCDANSDSFARLYRELNDDSQADAIPHSLLHLSRANELKRLLKADHLILAWGSNPVQQADAEAFLKLTKRRKPIGLALDYPWYRFASPYRKDQKLSWLKEITTLLQDARESLE